MKSTRQFLLVAVVSALLGACSHTQTPEARQSTNPPALDTSANADAQTVKLSGTVIDSTGKPVAGATVECWRYEGNFLKPGAMEMEKQTTTAADGQFKLHVAQGVEVLLARKPGLAPAWRQFSQPFNPSADTGTKLVLTPPGSLAGMVVDESNRPVADAEVFVATAFNESSAKNGGRSFNFFTGKMARDCFSAHTDSTGHFRIANFPTNAIARFGVKSPGKVLCLSAEGFNNPESSGCHAGQEDIKLVMEPAGSVEGKIIGATSDTSLTFARVTLESDQRDNFMIARNEPVSPGTNGVFRFKNVRPGSYHIRAVIGTNAFSGWITEAVPVSIEAGRTTRDVELKAIRGGVLDVTVLGEENRKPVAQVGVNAYQANFQAAAGSDSNGVVRLRLLPGNYQIMAFRQSLSSAQTTATVEAGTTNRIEILLPAPRKIMGIVRGPDGKPAAGLPVQLVGGYGPMQAGFKTDANGRFELEWNPRQIRGQGEQTACVLIRDADHNLAAAQDIGEDTTNLDLKLAPGLTLVGRAEADGKPITNTTATLVFWAGRSGMWLQDLARTNTPGQYEIPALPPGRRYGVIVSAPGFGQKQLYNLDISADAGRQKLDTVELKPANLKLAGQLFDADNKPVAGCYVNLNGDGQPNAHARTDRNGRFIFEHVCAGALRLFANSQNSFGSISAEGGDTNVVLQLGQNYSSAPGATMHKLTGVVTDDSGQPAVGAQAAVFPNASANWVKTGSNGEYHLTWSLQPWQLQYGAWLVFRDKACNLAGAEELPEDATNLNVKLKPAVTFSGQVKDADGNPLAEAHITLWFKAGNNYDFLDRDTMIPVNAEGRFEVKCLPPDGQYLVAASAKGFSRHQQQLSPEYETNLVELDTFVLHHADRVIAGRVLKDDDKPASGVNVQLNGEDQPEGYMTTDSKGRFHFKVCEGQVRLFAYSQYGGGNAQATVEAGNTNIVMTLFSSQPGLHEAPRRAALKGGPLPDLTSVNLAADAAPVGQPVLLCLFNAGERPSRHVIHVLDERAAALKQKHICVLGVQAAIVGDEIFNEWKTNAPVSFPVGRVTVKSEKSNWARDVAALPWLILTDANHRVVAEGFSLDELDAQFTKMLKDKG